MFAGQNCAILRCFLCKYLSIIPCGKLLVR